MEPLSGYISLAEKLNSDNLISGESFNFGPPSNSNYKVIDVVKELSKNWSNSKWEIKTNMDNFNETKAIKT